MKSVNLILSALLAGNALALPAVNRFPEAEGTIVNANTQIEAIRKSMGGLYPYQGQCEAYGPGGTTCDQYYKTVKAKLDADVKVLLEVVSDLKRLETLIQEWTCASDSMKNSKDDILADIQIILTTFAEVQEFLAKALTDNLQQAVTNTGAVTPGLIDSQLVEITEKIQRLSDQSHTLLITHFKVDKPGAMQTAHFGLDDPWVQNQSNKENIRGCLTNLAKFDCKWSDKPGHTSEWAKFKTRCANVCGVIKTACDQPAPVQPPPAAYPVNYDSAPAAPPANSYAAPVEAPMNYNSAPVAPPANYYSAPVAPPANYDSAPVASPANSYSAPVEVPVNYNSAPVENSADYTTGNNAPYSDGTQGTSNGNYHSRRSISKREIDGITSQLLDPQTLDCTGDACLGDFKILSDALDGDQGAVEGLYDPRGWFSNKPSRDISKLFSILQAWDVERPALKSSTINSISIYEARLTLIKAIGGVENEANQIVSALEARPRDYNSLRTRGVIPDDDVKTYFDDAKSAGKGLSAAWGELRRRLKNKAGLDNKDLKYAREAKLILDNKDIYKLVKKFQKYNWDIMSIRLRNLYTLSIAIANSPPPPPPKKPKIPRTKSIKDGLKNAIGWD